MTDEQFDQLMAVLQEIRNDIARLGRQTIIVNNPPVKWSRPLT